MQILTPRFTSLAGSRKMWQIEREFRTGRLAAAMLRQQALAEREQTTARLNAAAEEGRRMGIGREFGGDLEGRRCGVVDVKTFLHWQQEDPHFWEDKKNVHRFFKDNPQTQPWKH